MKKFNLMVLSLLTVFFTQAQTVSTFENITLAPESYWNGSDLSGGFTSGNAHFENYYDTTFVYWGGFSVSNTTDDTTAGYTNEYSAYAKSGVFGSANYATVYAGSNSNIQLQGNAIGKPVNGFYITNTTLTALSMKNGDQFAKKFGGATGTDPDWYRLTVKGMLNGNVVPNSVEFYLADYRSADSTQDYIVKDWTWLNLLPLGNVDALFFETASSDTGAFGMNTPSYFAMDNFVTNENAINFFPIVNGEYVGITYIMDTTVDVLANDNDATALPLNVSISGNLIGGALIEVTPNQQIHYIPAQGIVATDEVTYNVCDGLGACTQGVLKVEIISPVGINEVNSIEASVFPNPFNTQLNILTSDVINEVQVYDITGKLLMLQYADSNRMVLNTENLSAGMYAVKILTANGSAVTRVTK
jgi:hypothetical protein